MPPNTMCILQLENTELLRMLAIITVQGCHKFLIIYIKKKTTVPAKFNKMKHNKTRTRYACNVYMPDSVLGSLYILLCSHSFSNSLIQAFLSQSLCVLF